MISQLISDKKLSEDALKKGQVRKGERSNSRRTVLWIDFISQDGLLILLPLTSNLKPLIRIGEEVLETLVRDDHDRLQTRQSEKLYEVRVGKEINRVRVELLSDKLLPKGV